MYLRGVNKSKPGTVVSSSPFCFPPIPATIQTSHHHPHLSSPPHPNPTNTPLTHTPVPNTLNAGNPQHHMDVETNLMVVITRTPIQRLGSLQESTRIILCLFILTKEAQQEEEDPIRTYHIS